VVQFVPVGFGVGAGIRAWRIGAPLVHVIARGSITFASFPGALRQGGTAAIFGAPLNVYEGGERISSGCVP
jgi:hypothetical protein